MTPKQVIDRLEQIAKTLETLSLNIDNKKEPFIDLNIEPDDIKQAQYLIEDLMEFNKLQKNHAGSFIDLSKARSINGRYNSKFLQTGGSGRLPLMNTQMWFVDAEKLRILTDFTTDNGVSAQTICIYPGVVTEAEDNSMNDKDERFTLIFSAVDKDDNHINNSNLSSDIRREIDAIQPVSSGQKSSTAAVYDVLEEIGTCKPPQSCIAL